MTGAGAGLGAAFARAIAADGTAVLVNNRRRAGRAFLADQVAEGIVAAGGRAVVEEGGVDDSGAAERIVAGALSAFGRLDALVLNAGVSGPAVKVGTGDSDVREVMAINFFANVALVEAALPHLTRSPAGRIVFVSSTGGLYGVRGRAAYAASKGAVNGWALSLADELRRTPVRVNILMPYAATAMTAQPGRAPDPRLAPEGAAGIAAWLASPACARTGEMWVAGGGHVRTARAMESCGKRFDPIAPEELAGMPAPRGFAGGEAAFADFYAELLGAQP